MSRPVHAEWTDAQNAHLTKLWNEGLSAATIGRAMGLSKNAVVSKTHRLALARRASPIGKKASSPRNHDSRPCPAPRTTLPSLAGPEAAPEAPSPVGHSGGRGCQFPLWPNNKSGRPDFPMCGGTVPLGGVWCDAHRKVVFQPQRQRDL